MLVKFYHKPYSDLMQIEAANSLWNGLKIPPPVSPIPGIEPFIQMFSKNTHTEDVTKWDTFRGFNTCTHRQLTRIWGA